MANIIEGIQKECNRVRRIIPFYDEIGNAGAFGKAMLEAAIKEGEESIASGDIVRMVQALTKLRECQA